MSSIDRITDNPTFGCLTKLIFVVMLIWGAGMGGWFAGKAWIQYVLLQPTSSSDILRSGQSSPANVSPLISDAELQRKTALRHRRRELGVNSQFFSQLVAQLFVAQYPEQQEKALTDKPEDAPGREQWDKLAAEVLEQLSFLSSEALKGLGSYTQEQRDHSIKAVNQLHLSSHAFYDLVDANFVAHFPQQEKPDFSTSVSSGEANIKAEQHLGQVWQAIALDTLKALQSGKAYEQVNLATDASATPVKGILQPGEGKAYVVRLNASQTMEIELEADGDTFLSIYSPTGKNNPLEDSSAHQWSGVLPESGFYEFTLVSKTKQPLNYQLDLKVRPVENP